jgi:hypothetical protein
MTELGARPETGHLALLRNFLEAARQNERVMDGTMGPVLEICYGASLVVAFWRDREAPIGYDWLVVKGEEFLQHLINTDTDRKLKCTGILCCEEAQAMALQGYLADHPTLSREDAGQHTLHHAMLAHARTCDPIVLLNGVVPDGSCRFTAHRIAMTRRV